MKKIVILALTLLFMQLLFTGTALADMKLYADNVKNLKGHYIPETSSVKLQWTSRLVNNPILRTENITIARQVSLYDWETVGTINVNDVYPNEEEPRLGVYREEKKFSYIITNVSLDKKYRYRVACGEAAWKTEYIYVTTEQIEEDSEGIGPGGDTPDERREKYESSTDWPERMASSILLAIPNYIVQVIGLDDPLELIYQINLNDDSDFTTPQIVVGEKSDVYLHTFTKEEFGALAQFYDRLNEFVPIYLVVIVVLLGVGFLFVSANPDSRLGVKDCIIGLLIGLGALKFGIYLIAMIFEVNYVLVKSFEWIIGDKLSSSFLDSLINTESSSLGSVIITFLAVFSIGLINWQYTLRKVMLALLIGLIPVVAIIAMTPFRRGAIEYWVREFIAQVFLQASHAAALTLILLLIYANAGFWLTLVGVLALPTISGVVRRVIGAESFGTGMASGIGTALGLGSLFALSKMLKPDQAPKVPINAAGSAGEAAAGAAGEMAGKSGAFKGPGNFLGNMAKTGFRTATGVTAGVAGGLMTGAATGNPGFGLAAGLATGTAVSGGIANATQGAIDYFKKSPVQRMEDQGIIDSAQLDDPGQAFEYGKNMLGGGVFGTVAGLGMAAGKKVQSLTGQANPDIARQVKGHVEQNSANLSRAKQQLADYKPVYDEAKARASYAKNMFGPGSAHMAELKTQANKLETRLHNTDSRYAEALDEWHGWEDKVHSPTSMNPAAVQALHRVEQAKEESHETRMQFQEIQERITLGEQEHTDANNSLQSAEAEYAQRQAAVSMIQQNLSRASIKQEFEKLKAPRQETSGGINSSWRM